MANETRKVPERINLLQWTNETIQKGWLQYFRLKQDFEKIVRKLSPDLIHAGPIQKMAFLPALINFHPLISMSWGTDMMTDAHRNLYWDWVTRFTLQHTDVFISDCQAVGRVATQYSFPGERMVIFPWGVDLDKFKPGKSKKLRGRMKWGDEFIILSTRNWEDRYGVDLVVQAFCSCAAHIPQARLVLVGGGSLEDDLKKMVSAANLEGRVSFIGRIDYERLPEYYQAADFYVSASHSDGSSVSLMEALACGLPSLISDIPSSFEWVEPGMQGWLFKDNDVDDLSKKIIEVYEQRHHLEDYKKNARKTAETKADWSKNSQLLFHAYEMAIKYSEK